MLTSQQFRDAITRLGVAPSHRLLLAVSGGLDSMCMLHMAQSAGVSVAVAHANFGLRGAESDADQALVKRYCKEQSIPFFTKGLPISKRDAKDGIQAEARRLRYAWFDVLMASEGFDFLLTAHHRDDAMETFFMHLLRGAGIKGLRSIPEKNGYVLRPLLGMSKAEIMAYATLHGLTWREDASNAEDAYLRNRIRHQFAPAFSELGPHALENLAKSIAYITEADDYLEQAGSEFIDKHLKKDQKGILALSFEQAQVLWRYPALAKYVFDALGFEPNQIQQAEQLVDSQSGKGIEGSRYRMIRDRDGFVFAKVDRENKGEIEISGRQGTLNSPFVFSWETSAFAQGELPSGPNIAALDASKLQFPLTLRPWKDGDRFVPLGMKGAKKLSDFLIDEKCSLAEKEQVYVLVSNEMICWVVGYRIDDRFKITPKTAEVLKFVHG